MKNLAIQILIIFLISINLDAQILPPYKAKEAIDAATKSATEEGLQKPELMFIATYSGEIPNFPVKINFSLDKGTSTAWLYQFRSAVNKDSTKTLLLTKNLFGQTFLSFPLNIPNFYQLLPFKPEKSLTESTYMDSDEMAIKIMDNNDYKEYKTRNPDVLPIAVGVSINILTVPEGFYNQPVWGVRFESKEGSLNCMVHGVTGEVVCIETIVSVAEFTEVEKVNIYPNPASEYIYCSLPQKYRAKILNIDIFNQMGKKVNSFNFESNDKSEIILIPLNNLTAGLYFLKISDSISSVTESFLVNR